MGTITENGVGESTEKEHVTESIRNNEVAGGDQDVGAPMPLDSIGSVVFDRYALDLSFTYRLGNVDGRWWTVYQGAMPSYENYKNYYYRRGWWRFANTGGKVTSKNWEFNDNSLYTLALFNAKWELADFDTFKA